MDHSFWERRWKKRQTPFHQQQATKYLLRYHSVAFAPGAHVMVPLAGKSQDMAALCHLGYWVTGIEFSETAVAAFVEEYPQPLSRTVVGAQSSYQYLALRHDKLTLLQADFFALSAEQIGSCDAIFDRAALIAIPPEQRVDYISQLRRLVVGSADLLLVALEHDSDEQNLPPFAITHAQVCDLFAGSEIVYLEESALAGDNHQWSTRGLDKVTERVYLIRFK